MPAAPEISNALGQIRRIEVLQELEAQHAPEPHRHVGVAAEVEVDLEGIRQHADPGVESTRVRGIEHGVRDVPAGVCQQDFLGEAENEKGDARGEALESVLAEGQLCGEGLVANDRPGHQVGEQGHERREIGEGLGGRRVAAIKVNDVGQRVEGVERDADGQDDAQHPERLGADGCQKLVQRLRREHVILEEPKEAQVGDDAGERRPVSVGPAWRRAG